MAIIINDFYSGERITEKKLDIFDSNFVSLQADVDSNKASITAMINKVDDVNNPLTVSMTLDKTVIEKGSTVDSVTVSWTTSKNVNSQTFEGEPIDATLRSKTYIGEITSDKTFTLTATTIGGLIVSASKTLNFYNGIYYGISSSETYDSGLINSLTKVLSGTKGRTITVNSTSNTYIYYCLPVRLCSTEPVFTCNGFSGGFSKVATLNFVNSSSFVESYYVYKSNNSGLGSTTITIS